MLNLDDKKKKGKITIHFFLNTETCISSLTNNERDASEPNL